MKRHLSLFFGFFFLLAFTFETRAQFSPDSTIYEESMARIRQVYLSEMGDNAQIYHGAEYIRNGQRAIGFPYYMSDNMLTGSISYQGVLYSDVSFFYNLVSDNLIINNYAHNALIILSPLKADSFIVSNHFFLMLAADKSNGLTRDGYYEELYPGEPGLFVKREKRLENGSGSQDTKYIQYDSYFVRLKNEFHSIEGKNALLDLLKDQEVPLKKYIRSNKLNFKKNLEYSLVSSIIYYSRLKK